MGWDREFSPWGPIDNNRAYAEQEIRGVVIVRKNHHGPKSKRGCEVAAIFYTLSESAKLAGVDPGAYVLEAARRAISNRGAVSLPQHLIVRGYGRTQSNSSVGFDISLRPRMSRHMNPVRTVRANSYLQIRN